MLNFIWLALIFLAVVIGGCRGEIGAVGSAAIDGANKGVVVAGGLLAIMTLWLGLMRLADRAGLVHRLGLLLKPLMRWLFPEVPADHPAMGAIIMNVAANMLGLNNAATPLGLRAMNELQRLNRRPGVATNAMCMLLAINTSNVTLIPVTVIGLMTLAHSRNPTAIIGTSLAATLIAHIVAILLCKVLERSPFYRLPPPSPETIVGTPLDEPDLQAAAGENGEEGRRVEEQATRTDADLPWVPGARWMLAAFGGLFVALLLAMTFPPLIHQPLPAGASTFFGARLLNAVSVLAIPFVLVFFPFYASLRRIPVYEEFVEGAKEGFNVILRILPYIVGMLAAVYMFNASGGMDMITQLVSPVTGLIGFPPQLVPLALIRPFSSAASLPLLQSIITTNGPDSLVSLMAGTMYGCSETTFYVIAIYFGSVSIRKTRHAIPAGLAADIVGPLASVFICRAVFG